MHATPPCFSLVAVSIPQCGAIELSGQLAAMGRGNSQLRMENQTVCSISSITSYRVGLGEDHTLHSSVPILRSFCRGMFFPSLRLGTSLINTDPLLGCLFV